MSTPYQAEEKISVAQYYQIDPHRLFRMEFHRWRRLANRRDRELNRMFARCLTEGTEEERRTPLCDTRFYVKVVGLLGRGE